jgi:Flp pilus assembly pilin Flp
MYSVGEEGQGLVEYSLILLFIAILLIVALTLFGTTLVAYFGSINSTISALAH